MVWLDKLFLNGVKAQKMQARSLAMMEHAPFVIKFFLKGEGFVIINAFKSLHCSTYVLFKQGLH